ncbi:nucleotide sugar dehydrogenase [Methylobacterium nigriterrae]|uniref:nucleotide sugar dehydrogenase n=1 Tax=Methylobacterium nigriterrae TaxID=3127512 RepID=UPI0030136230
MGPSLAENLASRIAAREAGIGVIGMGYVGLPLARTAAEQGFEVVGLDIDRRKVKALNAGRSYISHISSESLADLRKGRRFSATSDFARLAELDVVIVCVPTPLNRHREPDLSFIVSTAQRIRRHLRRGQLIILESTTYPGTTNDVLKPILESSGLDSGVDFFLAYSPEREDPGNQDQSTAKIPKVVGGDGSTALDLAAAVYGALVSKVVRVSSPETAEAAKLTENIFRAVNIALANELKLVFEPMKIDIWEVIEAAKTKPFGFMPFYPGPGLGGHCIPIDPFYLTWKAREFGVPTRFIELAGEINDSMPRFVIERLSKALDQSARRGLNGASVLVVGLAYKKNVDDMRESPSLRIIDLIEGRGGRADYYDPFIPEIPSTRDHAELAGRRSIGWERSEIERYDAVIIVTDHDGIDYAELSRSAKLIVDTRNAIERAGVCKARVFKA